MARKQTRAQTGRLVARSVEALSGGLLVREEEARRQVEDVFLRPLGDVAAAVGTLKGLPRLSELADAVVVGCVPIVRDLWAEAAFMSLAAIGTELEAIERNLGRKFDGLANAAVERVDPLVVPECERQLPEFVQDVAAGLVWAEEQRESTVRASLSAGEEREDMVRRIVSATPVRLPGQSGVGLWWKPMQTVMASAKAQEFVLVNRVRQQAMYEFNRIGAAY